MAFVTSVEIRKQFDVGCPFDRVYDLLADIAESANYFPKVEQVVDRGKNAFQWKMQSIGIDFLSIQPAFTCNYIFDREKGSITWTSVTGEGSGTVSGSWLIKAVAEKITRVEYNLNCTLEIALPKLLRLVVAPLIAYEIEKMVNAYHKKLRETFIKPAPKKAEEKPATTEAVVSAVVPEANAEAKTVVEEAVVEKAPVEKVATKKTAAKKPAAKKSATKKPAAKKATAKKTAAKKATARKTTAKKPAAKKATAKKAVAKKAAAKKPAAKKAAVKKPTAKKPVAKKATAKKTAKKKPAAKKATAKKTAAKKPAAKKKTS